MTMNERKSRGRPKSPFTETGTQTMQALDRALGVLHALARQERASLTDLSLSLGIPTATTHRILTTLQKHRFAELDEGTQDWMVGIEAYRTGASFLKRMNLSEISRPVMRALMQATGETANLAIRDGAEVVFIGQVETPNPIRAFFNPGTRTPMHASGTGKAILATLPEPRLRAMIQSAGLPAFTDHTLSTPVELFADLDLTRARGWSFDREERHLGMACIGAAIFDVQGEALGGVSISGPSARFDARSIPNYGRQVAAAAAEITRALGGTPPA
jgi:IclR family acetate operon transcriptional repressor